MYFVLCKLNITEKTKRFMSGTKYESNQRIKVVLCNINW